MAKGDTGKWVARAGATGGGRSRGSRGPLGWYVGVAIVVVLGLASIVWASYSLRHPAAATPPTSKQPYFAGINFDICGQQQPVLKANTAASGIDTPGQGIVQVAPGQAKYQGTNAKLGVFVTGYGGLELTSQYVWYPAGKLLRNGDTCEKGTPDAGKKGSVVVEYWPNFSTSTGHRVSGNPRELHFTNGQLITVAFVPAGAKVPKPPKTTIDAVLQSLSGTVPTTTTTTAPGATTTTVAGSATTAPAPAATTTTAAPAAATTTTAPATTTTAANAKK